MFSSIPIHALFWTLPFTFTPTFSSLIYLEGQGVGDFKQFQIGAQHRGLSGAYSQQQLGTFQSIAADIGGSVVINSSLKITCGLSYGRNAYASSSFSSLGIHSALLYSTETSTTYAYVNRCQYSLPSLQVLHIYQINQNWNLLGAWASIPGELTYGLNYLHNNLLISVTQTQGKFNTSLAIHQKKWWLKVGIHSSAIPMPSSLYWLL
tara:strand:+ start:21490 stop:22110 length:621 start_codon:yes stop_codon:yes gene_type:complete